MLPSDKPSSLPSDEPSLSPSDEVSNSKVTSILIKSELNVSTYFSFFIKLMICHVLQPSILPSDQVSTDFQYSMNYHILCV
jgi:hypothetical protein